jgi:hypothetical protein
VEKNSRVHGGFLIWQVTFGTWCHDWYDLYNNTLKETDPLMNRGQLDVLIRNDLRSVAVI